MIAKGAHDCETSGPSRRNRFGLGGYRRSGCRLSGPLPARTLSALGETGESCTVYTDLQVSENDMRLLGFAEAAERDWFRLLTQVQGVGSKVGLAILSALSTAEVQAACANGDAAMVARANGVGPKLAGGLSMN